MLHSYYIIVMIVCQVRNFTKNEQNTQFCMTIYGKVYKFIV